MSEEYAVFLIKMEDGEMRSRILQTEMHSGTISFGADLKRIAIENVGWTITGCCKIPKIMAVVQ